MFHSNELFHRKGTDLSNVWIAGTLGSKKLSKTAVLKYNLAKLCLSIKNPEITLPLPAQSTLLRGVVRIEEKQTSFLYIDALDTKSRLALLNVQSDSLKNNAKTDLNANTQKLTTDKALHGEQLRQQQTGIGEHGHGQSNSPSGVSASAAPDSMNGSATLGSLRPVLVESGYSLRHLDNFVENAAGFRDEIVDETNPFYEQFFDPASINQGLFAMQHELDQDFLTQNFDVSLGNFGESHDDEVHKLLLSEGIDLSTVAFDRHFENDFFGDFFQNKELEEVLQNTDTASGSGFGVDINDDVLTTNESPELDTIDMTEDDDIDANLHVDVVNESQKHTMPLLDGISFQDPTTEIDYFASSFSAVPAVLPSDTGDFVSDSYSPSELLRPAPESETGRGPQRQNPDASSSSAQSKVILKKDRYIEVEDFIISQNLAKVTSHTTNRITNACAGFLDQLRCPSSATSTGSTQWNSQIVGAHSVSLSSDSSTSATTTTTFPPPVLSLLSSRYERLVNRSQRNGRLPTGSYLFSNESKGSHARYIESDDGVDTTTISPYHLQLEAQREIQHSIRSTGPILNSTEAAQRLSGISSFILGPVGLHQAAFNATVCPTYSTTIDLYSLALTNLQTMDCLEEVEDEEEVLQKDSKHTQHHPTDGQDSSNDINATESWLDSSYLDVEVGRNQHQYDQNQMNDVFGTGYGLEQVEYALDHPTDDHAALQLQPFSILDNTFLSPNQLVKFHNDMLGLPSDDDMSHRVAAHSLDMSFHFENENETANEAATNGIGSRIGDTDDLSAPFKLSDTVGDVLDNDIYESREVGFDTSFEDVDISANSLSLHHIGIVGLSFFGILSRAFALAEGYHHAQCESNKDQDRPTATVTANPLLAKLGKMYQIQIPRNAESSKTSTNTLANDIQTSSILHVNFAMALELECQRVSSLSSQMNSSSQSQLQVSPHDASMSFVHVLHLVNLQIVDIFQSSPYGEIMLRRGLTWDQAMKLYARQNRILAHNAGDSTNSSLRLFTSSTRNISTPSSISASFSITPQKSNSAMISGSGSTGSKPRSRVIRSGKRTNHVILGHDPVTAIKTKQFNPSQEDDQYIVHHNKRSRH